MQDFPRWLGLIVGVTLAAGSSAGLWFAEADDAATATAAKADSARAALHTAFDKNLSYCRQWLAAKDWKSLQQTAEGAGILAGMMGRYGDDDTWRAAARRLREGVQSLRSAAGDKQTERCQKSIEQLAADNKSLAKLPKTKPVAQRLTVSLRPMMALMDATHADAKAALAVGDLVEAKSMALVLSELGHVVSNQRAEAAWHSAGEALARAAVEAAEQTDAKAIRQKLRGVYEKCEACHNRQR
jgi:hypothetical protein